MHIVYFITIFLLVKIKDGNAGDVADLKILRNEVLPFISKLEDLENGYRLTKQELIKLQTANMKKVYDMMDRNSNLLKSNAAGTPLAKFADKKLKIEFEALESEAKISFKNCYECKLMREFDSIASGTRKLIDNSAEILQIMPKECLGLSATELSDCNFKRRINMLQLKKDAASFGTKMSIALFEVKTQIPNCYEDVYAQVRQKVSALRKSYLKNVM